MNAIKGSGPAGLSSIPRRRNIIVRPLIDYTHEELCRYLEVAGIGWREDETNSDTSYCGISFATAWCRWRRSAMRTWSALSDRTCDILGEEDAFMSQLAATALRACVRREQDGLVVLDARAWLRPRLRSRGAWCA